jgi:hypothetical protein
LGSLEPNPDLLKSRKDEIMEWFKLNNVVGDYVIIDDDTRLNALPKNLKERLILTSPTVGLTPEHIINFRERFHLA